MPRENEGVRPLQQLFSVQPANGPIPSIRAVETTAPSKNKSPKAGIATTIG